MPTLPCIAATLLPLLAAPAALAHEATAASGSAGMLLLLGAAAIVATFGTGRIQSSGCTKDSRKTPPVDT